MCVIKIMSEKAESTTLALVLKALLIPLSFPFLIIRILKYLKMRKFKECLPGKVVLITGARLVNLIN